MGGAARDLKMQSIAGCFAGALILRGVYFIVFLPRMFDW